MRVIQLRQRRLLTACALAGLGLMVLYLLVSSHFAESPDTGARNWEERGDPVAVAQRHISHPGVVPRFLGMRSFVK